MVFVPPLFRLAGVDDDEEVYAEVYKCPDGLCSGRHEVGDCTAFVDPMSPSPSQTQTPYLLAEELLTTEWLS